MDWGQFYSEAKGWQTAIGALLGFGGLMTAALVNSRLNRKRDERLRHEEIVSIVSALYGEIVLQRRSLARMANAVGRRYIAHGLGHHRGTQFDTHFIEDISLPPQRLYPALAGKVGMLPSVLALEVVRFFSRLEEAQTWLPRLLEDEDRGYSYGVNFVLDPAIDAITGISPALRIMEKLIKISDEEGLPGIKDALSAQSHENEMHPEGS